jgi:cytochrome c2
MVSPNPDGMLGEQAGLAANLIYSPAFRDTKFVCTQRALDPWLLQLRRILPGGPSDVAGVPDGGNRNDLTEFLIAATSKTGDH